MTCTHPVIYETRDGVQVCHICGAVIDPPPQEPPKAEPKRGKKTKADYGISGRRCLFHTITPGRGRKTRRRSIVLTDRKKETLCRKSSPEKR